MTDVIIDQFDQSEKPVLYMGDCSICGKHTVLVDGECVSCFEEKFPLLKEIRKETDEKETSNND